MYSFIVNKIQTFSLCQYKILLVNLPSFQSKVLSCRNYFLCNTLYHLLHALYEMYLLSNEYHVNWVIPLKVNENTSVYFTSPLPNAGSPLYSHYHISNISLLFREWSLIMVWGMGFVFGQTKCITLLISPVGIIFHVLHGVECLRVCS